MLAAPFSKNRTDRIQQELIQIMINNLFPYQWNILNIDLSRVWICPIKAKMTALACEYVCVRMIRES